MNKVVSVDLIVVTSSILANGGEVADPCEFSFLINEETTVRRAEDGNCSLCPIRHMNVVAWKFRQ